MEEKPKRKTFKIVLGVVLGLSLLAAASVAYLRYFKKDEETGLINLIKTKKTEPLFTNLLDGRLVSKEASERHPLAVMIENHPDARPQIGLAEASIIYEAITEGGITRFMAIYGPSLPEKVGPVRSARTYFIDWLSEFNAYYAHVGGNLDALEKIQADGILDLDEFALGKTAYWREFQAGKATEHTMYASPEKLYAAAKVKGWSLKIDKLNAFKFKKTKTTKDISDTDSSLPTSTAGSADITIDFSSPTYQVVWRYDPTSNKYLRSMAGLPHKDQKTGDQLSAGNIIIQSVERWEALTRINENGWAMKTIGEGKAKVFTGGKEIEATWKKANRLGRTMFYDATGKEIEFTPGPFWYEIVPPDVFSKI